MARAGAAERRIEVLARLPIVFGLSAPEAAAAVGISETSFRMLMEANQMPRPKVIRGRRVWDVDELRAAFKALPKDEQPDEADEWVVVE